MGKQSSSTKKPAPKKEEGYKESRTKYRIDNFVVGGIRFF